MSPRKLSLRTLAALVAAATATATSADATVLTFDINNSQPSAVLNMDAAYGDRVSALVQNNASYGVGLEGFTPNVVASYSGGFEGAALTRWNNDYGDLVNVLENESDGDTLLRILFTADAGYTVNLFGFDLGGWPDSDYTIAGLTVTSGDSTLYSATSVHVEGSSGHSAFSFAGPLAGGQTLAININLSGLGGLSDNIGIDNVRFGQSPPAVSVDPPTGVPEPATWTIMIVGFGAIGAVARRRRTAWAATRA